MNRQAFRTICRARAGGPSFAELDTKTLSPYFLQTQTASFGTTSAYFADESNNNNNKKSNPFETAPKETLKKPDPSSDQPGIGSRQRNRQAIDAVAQLADRLNAGARLRDRSVLDPPPGDRAPRVVDIRTLNLPERGTSRGRGGLRGKAPARTGNGPQRSELDLGGHRLGPSRYAVNLVGRLLDRRDGMTAEEAAAREARLARRGARGSATGRGAGRGVGVGLRGRGGRKAPASARGGRGGRAARGKGRSPDEEDPDADKKRKRGVNPLDVQEPEQKEFEDAVRFGTETTYNPTLGLEQLKIHMPNVPGQVGANVHASLATLGTADHVGLSAELTPQMFARDLRASGVRYFADLEEKKRTEAFLSTKKPFNQAEKGTPAIQSADEAVRKSVFDSAVAGKMEAPKFTAAGKDPVQMSRNWHLRSETWGNKETRLFEEKLNSLLAKGKKAAPKKEAKKEAKKA